MNLTAETLLANVTYGVPSGNYDGSSLLFYSDPVRGANYYGGQGGIQTLRLGVVDFSGAVTFEATLVDNPDEVAWFEIASYYTPGPTTTVFSDTVTGNFTYIRARVNNFEAGTIESATVTF
jgi:hypothetical protein